MRTVTAIKDQRKKSRVSVFLDGAFAFSAEREVVQEQGLQPGQALPDWQVDELMRADLRQRCLSAALRLLSYRPRSEMEMRRRLGRRFDSETVESILVQLRQKGLVDDAGFVTYWKENREAFRPRSRRLLAQELRWKGVDPDLVREGLKGMDDEESAYRAARNKLRVPEQDHRIFRNKLGAFLARRGYSYHTINRTIERLWEELNRTSQQ